MKETIIIVHGTFDSPQERIDRWYQPGSEFCILLDHALESLGSDARCWAHCEGDAFPIFTWDGMNDWRSRYYASVMLNQYIVMLKNGGWRCHVVAHSHGGNVALHALLQEITNYLHNRLVDPAEEGLAPDDYRPNDSWYTAVRLGEIVCLGTPFLNMPALDGIWLLPSPREEKPMLVRTVVYSGLTLIGACVILIYRTALYSYFHADLTLQWTISLLCCLVAIRSVVIGFHSLAMRIYLSFSEVWREGLGLQLIGGNLTDRPDSCTYWTHLLVQNTDHDEAFNLLNWFASKSLGFIHSAGRRATLSVIGRLQTFFVEWYRTMNAALSKDLRRSDTTQRKVVESIFVNSLVGTILVLLFAALIGFLSVSTGRFRVDVVFLCVIITALVYLVIHPYHRERQQKLWYYLTWPFREILSAYILENVAVPVAYRSTRTSCYGLNLFPYAADEVTVARVPHRHSSDFYVYEDIKSRITTDVHAARSLWLNTLIQEMPRATQSPEGVETLFRQIVGNPALVHNFYYRDPSNIKRIAEFLARRR